MVKDVPPKTCEYCRYIKYSKGKYLVGKIGQKFWKDEEYACKESNKILENITSSKCGKFKYNFLKRSSLRTEKNRNINLIRLLSKMKVIFKKKDDWLTPS